MKKRSFIIGLVLLMFLGIETNSFAQDWNERNDFAGGNRYGVSYFTLDGDAYMLGGFEQEGGDFITHGELWVYDVDTDIWEIVSEYPEGKIYDGFSFVLDNTVYVGLGGGEFGTLNDEVWAYNTTDGWVEKTEFPGVLRRYPFAFSGDEKGYVGCGYGGEYLVDMWEYDPLTDEWTAKADYPGGGRVGLVSFSISHKGYVGLGDDGTWSYNNFYEYDAEGDSWIPRASFFGENRSFSASTSVNGLGYMVGGETTAGLTNEMWSYDPISNSWDESYNFTELTRFYGVLYFIDGSFYYGLGQVGFGEGQVLSDFWVYESDIVGIETTPAMEDVAIYPNPTKGLVKIGGDLGSEDILNIKVYNSLMQEIHTTDQMVINMEAWENAVYFVQITTENGILTRKVIKQ